MEIYKPREYFHAKGTSVCEAKKNGRVDQPARIDGCELQFIATGAVALA